MTAKSVFIKSWVSEAVELQEMFKDGPEARGMFRQ